LKESWEINIDCTGAGNDNSQIGRMPCGRTITVKAEDIIITYRKFWDGEKLDYFSIKCPHCGSITDIDERKLPQQVKDYAYEKEKNQTNKWKEMTR